jgi:hypothetical protein
VKQWNLILFKYNNGKFAGSQKLRSSGTQNSY